MLFPAIQANDTLRESFIAFRQDPSDTFRVNVRRTRAAQIRRLLSNPESVNLDTFQQEVWNIETRTHLRSRNIDLRIAENPTLMAPSVEQLLSEEKITIQELEAALLSGDLELHGNYIWRQAAHLYAPRLDIQLKLAHIQRALQILNNSNLTPLEKARHIDAIYGFGENNSTGLVMLFHPDEFAIVNVVSKGVLSKLGMNLTTNTPLESIQQELRSLKEALDAQDFLELDLFLYLLTEHEPGPRNVNWLDHIKQVLEVADTPLSVAEITSRVLELRIPTQGRTPSRTVSYTLTTHPQVFEKVSDGVYRLRQDIQETETPSQEYVEPSFSAIYHNISKQGMRIDEQAVRRYHLALKTRGFVILAGLSGTGKTWLAEAYANAVGAEYRLIPVAPNWTTNEDLLGYVDPLNERLYHHTLFSYSLESAAQEYELAQTEGRHPLPYYVVLDEMNLARVEYYFAKFLSAMEVRAREGAATIELGAQKIVTLYPNLFFIGTINVDETTHDFADKIYDRAQLIELTVSRDLLYDYIGDVPYREPLIMIWDAVYKVAPFAFRIVTEIRMYVDIATASGTSWEEALDEQIIQKILPKCRGADLRIGDVLKRLEELLPVDRYPLSHAKVWKMREGFQHHGIASYF